MNEMDKERTERLQALKDRSLALIIDDNLSQEQVIQQKDKLRDEYRVLCCAYQKGEYVWHLDGLDIVKAEVVAVSINDYGYAFYRLMEKSGRNIGAAAWIPESEIFKTREDLIARLKVIIAGAENEPLP